MYKCNKCENEVEFEEINVIKTYINQEIEFKGDKDEFLYRENVVCLKCEGTMGDGDVIEFYD